MGDTPVPPMTTAPAPRIGYLLPTRERIMAGRPETGPLLALADRAEGLGYDSIWIGDSLLAKPRHDPITLMAAVAARTERVSVGSAVLLPALRNPVVLAQQIATLDRIAEGRLVLGVGIAADVPRIRAEFDAAGGTVREAGRADAGRLAALPGALVRRAGGLGGALAGPARHARADPAPPRRPADLGRGLGPRQPGAGRAPFRRVVPDRPRREAVGRAVAGSPGDRGGGRAGPGAVRAALYITLSIDDDPRAGNARIDAYLEGYYGAPAALLRKRQAVFAGPPGAAADWLKRYADEGAEHLTLRFVGDHKRMLETVAALRADLGWT